MNILFLTNLYPNVSSGGIERVTKKLSSFFKEQGCQSFNLFLHGNMPMKDKDMSFAKVERIDLDNFFNEKLRTFIINEKIDILINQGNFYLTPRINVSIQDTSCHIITAFHSNPVFNPLSVSEGISETNSIIKKIFIFLFYPIYASKSMNKLKNIHKTSYQLSDRTILLSNSYITDYQEKLGLENTKRIRVIANPLSFDIVQQNNTKKEKIVLIVARLYEKQKRLSLSLKIWGKIEIQIPDWKLVIVGSGPDKSYYQKMIKHLKLKNVFLENAQDPYPYYQKASLFLMTSKFEGFGLTLTECLQTGVVPIVMDSFSSLHDIIINDYNGIIVTYQDLDQTAAALIKLIQDEPYRLRLATNGEKSINKFSLSHIGKKWIELFNEIIDNKK